jgi:hypothetical protein
MDQSLSPSVLSLSLSLSRFLSLFLSISLSLSLSATFHNMSGKKLPCGSDQLLGLSLKFCIQEKIPKLQVAKTVARLRRALRLQAWLDAHSDEETEDRNDSDYIPGLYLTSTWTLPLAPTHIENGLSAFEGKLNDYFKQRRPNRSDNLTFFPKSRPETITNGHLPPRLLYRQEYRPSGYR